MTTIIMRKCLKHFVNVHVNIILTGKSSYADVVRGEKAPTGTLWCDAAATGGTRCKELPCSEIWAINILGWLPDAMETGFSDACATENKNTLL